MLPVVAFGLRAGELDIVLAVAHISIVAEGTAGRLSLAALEALHAERLIHTADGGADVFEFLVDATGDFGESDNHGEDGDGGDQHEFGRDDEAGFVVDQLSENLVVHGGHLSCRGWMICAVVNSMRLITYV